MSQLEGSLRQGLDQLLLGAEERIDGTRRGSGTVSDRPNPDRVDAALGHEALGGHQESFPRVLVVQPGATHGLTL